MPSGARLATPPHSPAFLKISMPGRRKSSTPCMVQVLGPGDPKEAPDVEMFRVEMLSEDNLTGESEPCDQSDSRHDAEQENLHPETSEEELSGGRDEQGKEMSQSEHRAQKSKGYECQCCPFWCGNLGDFKEHVDSSHPNVILNPLYRCAVCDFSTKKFELLTEHNQNLHPHENNFKFKRINKNNQTILEQSIRFQGRPVPQEASGRDASGRDASVFPPRLHAAVTWAESAEGRVSDQKDAVAVLDVNGTVIIPEASLLQDLSHVAPVLRRPPNYNGQPQIAVPLNSSKYNPSLDRNQTLITSFNKFPYPTHAELSWLTAASKHPREQIQVWFTTQRLKQGITWSPEEVEEARKKMFNGSVPAVRHTFASRASGPVGRIAAERQLRTAVPTSAGVASAQKVLAVGSARALKRSLMAHCGPESKRPVMAVAPSRGDPKDEGLVAPAQEECRSVAPPGGVAPFAVEMNKSPAVVPLMMASSSSSFACTKGKLPSNPKTTPLVSLPSMVFPASLTRRTIVPPPIFAPPFKSSLLVPGLSKEKLCNTLPPANVTFPNSPSLDTPRLKRPPVIQTPAKVPGAMPGREQQSAEEAGAAILLPVADGMARAEAGRLPPVDSQRKSSLLTQFPLLERMKGKTAEQLKILEEHFLRSSFLSHVDADGLAAATRLSHGEIDGWFAERRALRDNLELALLNSMGTKVDKDASPLLNGSREFGVGAEDGKSGSVPPPLNIPNSRSAAPVKDRAVTQTEGTAPPAEVWPGLDPVDLARWFCDSRSTLQADWTPDGGEKSAASGPRQEGGAKALEAELGRLMEQHGELQERLAGRCE